MPGKKSQSYLTICPVIDFECSQNTAEKVYETTDAGSDGTMNEKLAFTRFCTLLVHWLWL